MEMYNTVFIDCTEYEGLYEKIPFCETYKQNKMMLVSLSTNELFDPAGISKIPPRTVQILVLFVDGKINSHL